jgi:RpiB/LacA/LacB family sugar-phosphate isomerase
MKIVIGADHGGFELKKSLLVSCAGVTLTDVGTLTAEGCDYPDYADAVAEAVSIGEADFGVLVCTTGMGMSMAANRFQNVRAALCRDEEDARIARGARQRHLDTWKLVECANKIAGVTPDTGPVGHAAVEENSGTCGFCHASMIPAEGVPWATGSAVM